MGFPTLSVRRPVTTIMVFLGVILIGFLSWARLPQELYPPITYPQLTVVTSYENAAPEEIETLVTKPLEEVIGTVNRLKRLSSTSREGISIIQAEFIWGSKMDSAVLDIRDKIDLVKERLPREAEDPIVLKYNPFDLPVMRLSVSAPGYHPAELREIVRKQIKDELEKIEGVASASIVGGLEREIVVEVDKERLNASRVSLAEVVDSLKNSNVNYPAGTIKESFYEYLIRTIGEFKVLNEIPKVVVSAEELPPERTPSSNLPPEYRRASSSKEEIPERLILLQDLGQVKDTFKEKTSISRYNGEENISVSIQRQTGANVVRIVRRVGETLKRIKGELPEGIQISVVYDQSQFIRESLNGVRDSAVQGGMLAFVVLFLFLQSFADALIVSTAIPISIMATVALMYFAGLTLNTISLGGLALGIGMLVDNAIVVVENVYRHTKGNADRKEAAARGTEEVASALWGSTLTTIAVFFPIVFATGVAGQLFKELSYTVCFSVFSSLVVALTLTPVLASLLKSSIISWKYFDRLNQWGAVAARKVGEGVRFSLDHRWIVVPAIVLFSLGSMGLLNSLNKEFLPKIDQRQFSMKVDLPTGMRLEITDEAIGRIEAHLASFPEVKDYSVTIGSSKDAALGQVAETLGSHQSQILVNLRSSTDEVVARLKRLLENESKLANAQIEYLIGESVVTSSLGGGQPIVVEVRGSDLAGLKTISEDLQKEMTAISGVFGVKTSLPRAHPETKAEILRDRAALYNLSVRDIAETTQIAVKGKVATKFKEGGKEIDIRVRLSEEDRKDLSGLRDLFIHSPLGIEVPLSEVAYISEGYGPSEIRRLEGERVILVSANLSGKGLTQVEKEVQQAIDRLGVPPKMLMKISGESQQVRESFITLFWALVLSIILVYMIMASEFESLWQPMVIMITVPLAVIGVAWSLFILHIPVSVVVFLGMIVLGGIVVNNGIVLLEFVTELRSENKPLKEILVQAVLIRLRPILMTSLSTVLGLMPLALGLGEGAELQSPMAWTVIGGMTSATFLTLFVVPAIYLSFDGLIQKFKKK